MDKREIAISNLYKKYRTSLFFFLLKKGYEREDVHDIVQESFIKAYQKFDMYKDKYSITTWLYRIAINTAVDFHRKTVDNKNPVYFVDLDGCDIQQDEKEIKERGKKEVLNYLLGKLSEKERKVIKLRAMGLKYVEISKHMDISLSSTKGFMLRAREKLVNSIEKKCPYIKY